MATEASSPSRRPTTARNACTHAERLDLPAGTTTSWFLRIPAAAHLALGATDPGALQISIVPDGEHGRPRPTNADLTSEAGRLVRLTVVATSATALVRPEIRGREPGRAPAPPAAARRPNVVLYLTDTVRADHLGCYG